MCRVLYEANSQYGLQIIANKNVEDVRLGDDDGLWETGKTAYNSAITTLNSRAMEYLNEEYAVDARCVGSVPTIDEYGNLVDKNSETADTVKLQFSITLLPKDTGCIEADANWETDYYAMEQIGSEGIIKTEQAYWLASRDVFSNTSNCELNVLYIDSNGERKKNNLCGAYNIDFIYGFSSTSGLRPCFSLRSDIKITGEDGSSEAKAYVIE